MSLLPESLTNFVEGGLEAFGALVASRTVEIDQGVGSVDVAAQAIGLEPYTESKPAMAAVETQPQTVARSVSEVSTQTELEQVPSNVADLGAFRRLREAQAQVEQAHTVPASTSSTDQEQSVANIAPLRPVAPVVPLNAHAQVRLAEAQRQIDIHFNQAA